MKSILLFVIFSFSFIQLNAQCETDFTLENKKYFDELVRQAELDLTRGPDDIIVVPIVFYIETYNGTPVYNAANLNTVISQNNAYYAPSNVEFSICTIILFENGTSVEIIDHVIRVFIKTSYSGCGVSYGGGNITINPDCNRPFKEILGHEIGHELGLPHTHGYTNMGTTTELVDGSNCTTDGDRFCDTPADPNILYEVNGSCIYTGTRTDANGDFYNPDTHNLMSYARGGCPNHFSAEQSARVHSVAEAKAYYCCLTPEPEANDVSVCSGSSATINATITVGEIRWYDAPGGNLLYTGTSYNTPVLNSSASYFLVGYDGCESDPVRVSVNVLPGGGILSDISEQLTQLGNDTTFSSIDNVIDADSLLYLRLNYNELWSFAGGPGSEQLVFSVGAGGEGGNTPSLSSFAAGSNKILIGINDFTNGPSLWVSDGTAVGNELLFEWGNTDYRYSNFWITELNGSFIFELTRLPDENAEIWISDGTVAGTQMVVSLPNTSSFSINRFYNYNGKLYFKAASVLYDLEPWVTDGTAAGTYMLKEINSTGSANPENFIKHNGMLYFTADDGINGQELWKTNGTEENTTLVADINPDGNTYIGNLKSIDNYLYFSADNGLNGDEPYLTDGTVAGTVLIEDINLSFGSTPHSFTKCDGSVYFMARSVQGEIEDLYKFNPISNEISQVKEFSIPGSNYSDLVCYNNQLYFSSASEQNNFEPWVSDGTESGTVQWLDLNPAGSSFPDKFTIFNGRFIFSARDSGGEQFYRAVERGYHVCNGETVTITTQNYSGTVSWYDAPVDGNLLGTGYTFESDVLTDSISFWADLTDGGCTSQRSEIPVAVTTIELNADITHELNPADGIIDLTVSGGIPPYQFDWDTDGTGDFDDDEDQTGLIPGTYQVSVIDSSGCMSLASFEVFSVPQIVVDSVVHNDCFGSFTGSIEISIDGGTEPFDFNWNNGADTEDLFNLPAGEYILTLTDANDFIETVTVLIEEPEELLGDYIQIQQISCYGINDAAVEISVQGGTEPFEYALDGGSYSPENVFSNLGAGSYFYEVRDANGCLFSNSFEVYQPDELLASDSQTEPVSCNGESDAIVEITVQGGTPPFEYSIDGEGFELSNFFENLGAGNHIYTIMDANGCLFVGDFIVTEPDVLDYSIVVSNEEEPGNGSIDLTVTGGTPTYLFDWDNDGTGDYDDNEDLEMLEAGVYSVSVLDQNNCELVITAEVAFTVSINENGDLSEIKVFPNPTAGKFDIDFGALINVWVNIEIYNTVGEVVFSRNGFKGRNLEIDLSSEENGIYILRVYSETDIMIKQIIKQ